MSAGGISYSGLTTNRKVTLPSVDMWGSDMNILRNPLRSVMTRRVDKVGDTQNILLEQDASGDRIAENILVYARGVNPMVSVSYDNASNNSGSLRANISGIGQTSLPYKVQNVRPPLFRQEDLTPLSRLPRVWCHADTNPQYPNFKDDRTCTPLKKTIHADEEMLRSSDIHAGCFNNTTPTITDDAIIRSLQDTKSIIDQPLQGQVLTMKSSGGGESCIQDTVDMTSSSDSITSVHSNVVHSTVSAVKGTQATEATLSSMMLDPTDGKGQKSIDKNKQLYEAFSFLGNSSLIQHQGERSGVVDLQRHIHDQLLWMEARANPSNNTHFQDMPWDRVEPSVQGKVIESHQLRPRTSVHSLVQSFEKHDSSMALSNPSSHIHDSPHHITMITPKYSSEVRKEDRLTDEISTKNILLTENKSPNIPLASTKSDALRFTQGWQTTDSMSTSRALRPDVMTLSTETSKILPSWGDSHVYRTSDHTNSLGIHHQVLHTTAESNKQGWTQESQVHPYQDSTISMHTKTLPTYEWKSTPQSAYQKELTTDVMGVSPTESSFHHQHRSVPVLNIQAAQQRTHVQGPDVYGQRQVVSQRIVEERPLSQIGYRDNQASIPRHDHFGHSSSSSKNNSPMGSVPIVRETWKQTKQKAFEDYHQRNIQIRA